jgi:hypothetical protein
VSPADSTVQCTAEAGSKAGEISPSDACRCDGREALEYRIDWPTQPGRLRRYDAELKPDLSPTVIAWRRAMVLTKDVKAGG